jgi:hypothetical protein
MNSHKHNLIGFSDFLGEVSKTSAQQGLSNTITYYERTTAIIGKIVCDSQVDNNTPAS